MPFRTLAAARTLTPTHFKTLLLAVMNRGQATAVAAWFFRRGTELAGVSWAGVRVAGGVR